MSKEDYDKGFNDGLKEGYIQGMQEMIFRMTESFFNSPEAKESKIRKFEAELTDDKKSSKEIEKFKTYTNCKWI